MHGFAEDNAALTWTYGGDQDLRIEAWGPDSLRVRMTPGTPLRADWPNALLPVDDLPQTAPPEIIFYQDTGDTARATITNGQLVAEVTIKQNMADVAPEARLHFRNTATGQSLLREKSPHFAWPPTTHFTAAGGDLFRIEQQFAANPDERIYGLGQQQHGLLDQKGCVIDLIQRNSEVSIPFMLSSRGYGFLWNNPAAGRVELGHNHTRWVAEAAPQLDYWITTAQNPAGILSNYAAATGHPPPLPAWAAGFWQCKLRYSSQEELLSVAREHKERGLPLSVIVIDYFHWTRQGDWQFDPVHWPDPAAMVRELEEMGVKVMVSVWPTVNPFSPNFEPMRARGYLIRTEKGVPAHRSFEDTQPEGRMYMHYYDATHPDARAFMWDRVKAGYYDHGIKIFWLDADEPEMYPMHPEHLRYHLGSGAAITNAYPRYAAQALYDGLQAAGEDEVFILSRSAWAGSQRYGAAVWSGDIPSTFESLQKQVKAGLNMALSGIPWWTTDIGGFKGGDPQTQYFRELIVRWFQYGVFCPIFRLHGYREPTQGIKGGGPNEVWSFGEKAYTIIADILHLRERLRPYIMQQMQTAHTHGIPPMRPLFVDFPEDEACWTVEDQFMFGPDVMVAPVLHAGARERRVWLPSGARWTNAWTGRTLQGDQTVTVKAPLDRVPVFLRDGASVPVNA